MTSNTSQYFTTVPLVIPAFILIIGLYFVFSIAPVDTLMLRFSQTFFNVFTVMPFSIITLGGVIIFYALRERQIQIKNTTFAMIDIGAIIVLMGLGIFIFYVVD